MGTLVLLAGTTTPTLAVEASYTCTAGTRLTANFSTPGTSPGSVVLTIAGKSNAR